MFNPGKIVELGELSKCGTDEVKKGRRDGATLATIAVNLSNCLNCRTVELLI
jgi:hypothetical protein